MMLQPSPTVHEFRHLVPLTEGQPDPTTDASRSKLLLWGNSMKLHAAAASLLAVALLAGASGADAKGCIKGAVVGGVAGHLAGHHGVVGAAAGCVIGHHMAKKKQQQQREQLQQQPAPAPQQHAPPPDQQPPAPPGAQQV